MGMYAGYCMYTKKTAVTTAKYIALYRYINLHAGCAQLNGAASTYSAAALLSSVILAGVAMLLY